jgi:hypothetical protein
MTPTLARDRGRGEKQARSTDPIDRTSVGGPRDPNNVGNEGGLSWRTLMQGILISEGERCAEVRGEGGASEIGMRVGGRMRGEWMQWMQWTDWVAFIFGAREDWEDATCCLRRRGLWGRREGGGRGEWCHV